MQIKPKKEESEPQSSDAICSRENWDVERDRGNETIGRGVDKSVEGARSSGGEEAK